MFDTSMSFIIEESLKEKKLKKSWEFADDHHHHGLFNEKWPLPIKIGLSVLILLVIAVVI